MDNPAQGLVDTIGANVMAPVRRGMDWLQNLDPRVLQQLLASVGGTQPVSAPPSSMGRDIALPNQSGRIDPRIARQMMLQRMNGG